MIGQNIAVDGIAITTNDILLVEPEMPPLYYSRIPEMRVIEAIRFKHPDALHQLKRNAFHEDAIAAEMTIENLYGLEASTALRSPQTDLRRLTARL